MGMNVFEIKGIAGEAIIGNDRGADDSIDSIRFRNFVNLTNGRGTQVDMSWDSIATKAVRLTASPSIATNGHV